MSPSLFGQLVFDGLAMGLVFVILATGLVLIMSTSRILFMAYGMFYTIGAYAVWGFMKYTDLSYFIALPIGLIAAGLLGMLSYILIFQRLQSVEGGFLATLIASMGLLKILQQGGLLVFGTSPVGIPPVFEGKLVIFGISLGFSKLVLIGLSVAVALALFWIYEKTNIGRAFRAVAFKAEVASLQGVNPNLIYMLVLSIGTALAGFAGGVLAPGYGINPEMGNDILWTVILMTMLGGMDSMLGAVMGGIVIGQMLSFGQYFIGSTIQIIIFLTVGIILYFKPNGLLGRGINIDA